MTLMSDRAPPAAAPGRAGCRRGSRRGELPPGALPRVLAEHRFDTEWPGFLVPQQPLGVPVEDLGVAVLVEGSRSWPSG